MAEGASGSRVNDRAPVAVVVHLSGPRRGTTQVLRSGDTRFGTAPGSEVQLLGADERAAPLHAVLNRRGSGFSMRPSPEAEVWRNGRLLTGESQLDSGDLLEMGRGGPVLRFRQYPPGQRPFKSMREAFSDCMECARRAEGNGLERAGLLLAGIPRELARETSPTLRWTAGTLLLALLGLIAVLSLRNVQLAERLEEESMRVEGLTELLERSAENRIGPEDLSGIRQELEGTLERVEALEERAEASRRVIQEAARSVTFLQGAYGWVHAETGRRLRFAAVDAAGRPQLGPTGEPIVTLGGDGPPVETFYTGTGFVAHASGLVLTNRHVAAPWEYERASAALAERGLTPEVLRFVGYLPGVTEAFEVSLAAASDQADLAVLRCRELTTEVPVLELGERVVTPGEVVIVMGYPTGIRALLARAGDDFVQGLGNGSGMDFWEVARQLSAAGRITALATSGIVGQVTPAAVVYDAETTSGGSGGPVLALDGAVVAVNVAILPEFGGSNLGVPAAKARRLLEVALAQPSPDAPTEPEPAAAPPTIIDADGEEPALPSGRP